MITPQTRVLIIDDSEDTRVVLTRYCKRYNYIPSTSPNGALALRLLENAKEPFDVVLIDQFLENNQRGVDILKQIKLKYSEIVTVLYTGEPEGLSLEALQAGADRYLAKPLSPDQFYFAIQSALRERHERQILQNRILETENQTSRLQVFLQNSLNLLHKTADEILQAAVDMIYHEAGAGYVNVILFKERQPFFLVQAGITQPFDHIRKDGLSWQIVQSGKLIFYENIPQDPEARKRVNPSVLAHNFAAILGLPMTFAGEQIGVMWFHYAQPRKFTQLEIHDLQLFSDQVINIYVRAKQLDMAERKRIKLTKILSGLHKALEAIITSATLQDTLNAICREALGILSLDYNSEEFYSILFLLDRNILVATAAYPSKMLSVYEQEGAQILDLSIHESGLAGKAALTKKSVYASDVSQNSDYFPFPKGFGSHLSIPLLLDKKVRGVLTIEGKRKDAFSDDDIDNLQFLAGLAAAAEEKALLLEQIKEYTHDVTHQLVGPLSGIRGWCEYLINVEMIEELRTPILWKMFHLAGKVQRYALGLTYLSEEPEDLYQGFHARVQSISRNELIELLIEAAISFQGEAKAKDVRGPSISVESFAAFPDLRIDKHLFEILILNLIDNAVKYSDEKQPVKIYGRVMASTVEIEIRNYGIPLHASDLEIIFQQHARTVQAIEAAPTGTGVGLYISQRIARLHGGDIRAIPSPLPHKSKANEVKFVLWLPLENWKKT